MEADSLAVEAYPTSLNKGVITCKEAQHKKQNWSFLKYTSESKSLIQLEDYKM